MKNRQPLFASERTAAALLDMKPSEFSRLVKEGHLPPPVTIGNGLDRWDVEQLRSIISGSAALGEELEW